MQEKRKLRRRHLVYYLRVFDRNTGQLIGYLVYITPDGIMLMNEDGIETDTIFQFRMALPAEVFVKGQLDFDAKSLWCERDINPDFFDTGFQLLNVSEQDIDIIKHLISDYGLQD